MRGDTLSQPQRFGRYILIDRLGKGGMAEVFRAVMPGVEGFRRDLVIKQIRPDHSHTRNFIEMFAHEARISALLHHPNIVQVFDFGQVDGCYFLAMELLRGRDLLAVMKALREQRRPFPVPIAAHIAQQVALGLAYAHGMRTPTGEPLNILHRDVSPSNIMCLTTGGVKLLDFGIASALGEAAATSEGEESTFKGKLSYMAPERFRSPAPDGGESLPVELDGRSDLFSLGTVLWEMLAGKRLFHGKTEADKLRALLDKPITPPSALRADIPARLDAIVLKALERDPDERYLTGQAFADDLEEIAHETRYQSRLLPSLLTGLFGVGTSKSHIAISNLSAELLFVEPIVSSSAPPPSEPVAAAGIPPLPPLPPSPQSAAVAHVAHHEPRTAGKDRTHRQEVTVTLLGGLVLIILGIAAAVASRPHRAVDTAALEPVPRRSVAGGSPSCLPGTSAMPASPAPAQQSARSMPLELPAPPPASQARSTAGPPVDEARGAAAHGAPVSRPPSRSSTRADDGRLLKGLSIDPFAEAASRHRARTK